MGLATSFNVVFLPIVQRELRISARKRGTMWVRLAGAFAALLIGSMAFAIQIASKSAASVGQSVFGILTLLACFAALSTGLPFTSDSLSEEKREGTLGFLFLTDLRGYDVVSGKVLAAAVRGVYMLLAAFPIVGITLFMGGVTGAAFWKTCVALLNALFASLLAGVFVSSVSREAQKALLGTMLLMFVWAGAGYLVDAMRGQTLFKLSSPFFLFSLGSSSRTNVFWESLVVNQGITWTLFALSCLLASRTWRDKPDRNASAVAAFGHWFKYGSARRRRRLRKKLMPINPVTWLGCRERWQAISFWVISGIAIGVLILIFVFDPGSTRYQIWSFVSVGLTLVLYIGFASQSCRFFTDARRTTVLELLLSTPLTGQQIIYGQWKAALRMFGPPLGVFLAAYFVGIFALQQSAPSPNPFQAFSVASARALVVAADLATLTWFGMWMGLISKSANVAAWKTLFFVQVLPWVALTFASGMLMSLFWFAPGLMRKPTAVGWLQFISSAIATIGSLAIDWWLFTYARHRLFAELRVRASTTQGRGG
jgi:hypothetical protein